MNAAGLNAVLMGVVANLKMPSFQKIVTDGSVSQNEFDGTLANLDAVNATIRNTPHEKLGPMMTEYSLDLTEHSNHFTKQYDAGEPLLAFREAQTMAGFITTVFAKSGLQQ